MDAKLTRRQFLEWGMACGAGMALGGTLLRGQASAALTPITGCAVDEVWPTSPFILRPFRDAMPVPRGLNQRWRPDPTLPLPQAPWTVRRAAFLNRNMTTPGVVVPGPGVDQQDSYGQRTAGEIIPDFSPNVPPGTTQTVAIAHDGRHQVWPTPAGQNFDRLENWPAAGVEPRRYHIRLQVGAHSFTTSRVRPINSLGQFQRPPAEANVQLINGTTTVPPSTIYGFNGTFPGPMINAEYGKPCIVRFENDLDKNPQNLDRSDFGAPDWAYLCHLHNGHTAPESDGQPHYMQINEGGYVPGDWNDNLYLNYPAGGDPTEIQSFLWFHDHRMHHTGSNVYKGMVGLFPIYDPGIPADGGGIVPGTGLDTGNESDPAPNLKLPGVKVLHANGVDFDVKYDIPMALYDCRLDDGVTPHADFHIPNAQCGLPRPDQWGKTFFRYHPNHGFVGDIFTVNGVAYPVLRVFRRKYRLRFLGASISRVYELCLMRSANGPVAVPGSLGQWQIPDGQLAANWTQIASMGGLLPTPIRRNTVQVWPATRNEHVINFARFPQGTELYITNILDMQDGRKPDFTPNIGPNNRPYKVPMVKIIVGGLPPEPDQSVMPVPGATLRPMPVIPDAAGLAVLPQRAFNLNRSGGTENEMWLINSLPFDPLVPLVRVNRGQPEVWTVSTAGGWVHPMHMHQEEHTVVARNGSVNNHPDDTGRADVVNLDPGEEVSFYRNFRTFTGRYVAHCHNLAHEDHNMMFGWTIDEPPA